MRHLWNLFEDRWVLRYKNAGLSRGRVDWNDKYKFKPQQRQPPEKKQGTHGNEYPFHNYLKVFWMRCTDTS